MADWSQLTDLTGGRALMVERVRLADTDVAVEGQFELPPLARLTWEDQVFVAAFVRSHGSIKEMERVFGVSYPTIKGRLNRVGQSLGFVEAEVETTLGATPAKATLEQLARGEITVDEAVGRLKAC